MPFYSPKNTRPTRDLLRQRSRLVALRATAYGGLRRLLLHHGLLDHSRNGIKPTTDEDLMHWFAHPLVRLHGQHARQRIELYTQQIDTLASHLLATVQGRPECHCWLTIPGLGKILAMTIVSEIGEMARFQNTRECSSYCRRVLGVAPSGSMALAKPGEEYAATTI